MDTTETREFVLYSKGVCQSKTMDDEIDCVDYPLERIKDIWAGC